MQIKQQSHYLGSILIQIFGARLCRRPVAALRPSLGQNKTVPLLVQL